VGLELGDDVMTKEFDSIQHAVNVQLNAVTTKLPPFGTLLQAIFAEGADYTKKSVDTRMAFVEKLLRRQVVRHRDSDPVRIFQDVSRRLRRGQVQYPTSRWQLGRSRAEPHGRLNHGLSAVPRGADVLFFEY
jgi:hypothetical protein